MAGTEYRGSEIKDVDQFLTDASGLESEREKEITAGPAPIASGYKIMHPDNIKKDENN